MAKREKAPKLNYSEELRRLDTEGVGLLYLLYGEEDYLREHFLQKLKCACLGEAEDEFNYRRIDGAAPDLNELAGAIDAMPFMSERSFVELRGFDINKCREAEAERLCEIFSDIPDYCTAAIVLDTAYVPDGRLSLVKAVKKLGRAMEFAAQGEAMLTDWVIKRFAAEGKGISRGNAQKLLFTSGTLMNTLIPEIDKIVAYAQGTEISPEDIEAVAQKIPETDVFEMCDLMSIGRFDDAATILSGLIDSKEEPIKLLALIGAQMRRLYAVRMAQENSLSSAQAMELSGVKFDFALRKLQASARRYERAQLSQCVTLCAEYDYKMKSTGGDSALLLTELFARLAVSAR